MYLPHFTSIVTILCWIAWVGYWMISWREEKTITEPQPANERVPYTLLLMLGFVGALAPLGDVKILGYTLVPYSNLAVSIGASLCVFGVVLTIWSRRVLATNWSADVAFKQDQELVTSGPYELVRHPIYSGLMLMFIGTGLVQGSLAAIAAIFFALASFVIKLRQEERLMLVHFGPLYVEYQQRTHRLIPWVY